MKRLYCTLAVICAVLLVSGPAAGQTAIISQPTDDARVSQYSPNSNYGSSQEVHVCTFDGHPTHADNFEQNTFVRFDLSSIPGGATVTSATLYLYYFDWWDNDPAGRALNGYRVMSGWSEGTITWATQPPASGPTTVQTVPSSFGWMGWDVTADVTFFLANPLDNYGWKIMDNNTWNQFDIPIAMYHSKEYGSLMPYLEVNYTVAGCLLNCPTGVTLITSAAGSGNKSPDMNSDGTVNLVDLSLFAAAWPPGLYNYCADFDCTGAIGLPDLALFAQHWGHTGPNPGFCQ